MNIKSEIHKYDKKDIEYIIEILFQYPNMNHNDLCIICPKLTPSKIKDIRFILKKGNDFHIDSMLKAKYTLTSIRNMI